MSEQQPVVLVPSRYADWAAMAAGMARRIHRLAPASQVEHIGSTAVPDLAAKDVVDLLVGVGKDRIPAVAAELAAAGFDLEGTLPGHCWLSYPVRAERRYVLHVVEFGGRPWQRRLAFRNLLRSDPQARERYLAAKRDAADGSSGWDAYTQAKTPVVSELLAGMTDEQPTARY
ncbi:GrpB family protein [Arthrobacter zhangbolii]|uniref:GrpB family protein n=1 Tax=Arthrobacter zhangbolii TaxID=2886936 RepID=A0A9X1M5B5_9MICC|nr:GrpB family protein [Arthrobacter zhangbolii]MCC3271175.1 GrpB family protein [Arthrobacter zhangbolii]UON91031.1 GrpB family protein [Arthrobacter zhangbolii]